MKNSCSCLGCDQPYFSGGWCQRHRYRFIKYGAGHWSLSIPGLIKVADTPELAEKKFSTKFKKESSGCWIWTGSKRKPFGEYAYETGEFKYKGKDMKAHRASWTIYRGEIPAGIHVLHKCHNPLCVNPDHLYLGDHATNMNDMAASGRSHNLKLTKDQVLAIRASNKPIRQLAREYFVDRSSIKSILAWKTHKNVRG